jgi:hypothetical protein
MPGVTRKNVDASTGHGGYPSRPNTPNGSNDVIVNGYGVVRIDDAWPSHTDPGPPDTQWKRCGQNRRFNQLWRFSWRRQQ